jgi:hypothetical protein
VLPGRPRSFRAIADAGSGLTRGTPANSGSEGYPNSALVPALPSKPGFAEGGPSIHRMRDVVCVG